MSKVRDGADRRRSRILAMMTFIETAGPEGCEELEVMAYMWERYGLKFETTRIYLREGALAGFLKLRPTGWIVTPRFKKYREM